MTSNICAKLLVTMLLSTVIGVHPQSVGAQSVALDVQTYIEPLSTPNAATISSGPDEGFLNFAVKAFESPRRHNTTTVAVDNLLAMMPAFTSDNEGKPTATRPMPWIVGHGNEGYFETGSGQTGEQTMDNSVLTWNMFNWGPQFRRLRDRQYIQLTILTCHTGAGPDGSQLLYDIAQETQKVVRARTGFTYCNSNGVITYEANSTWQVAVPGQGPPTPIAAPTPHFASAYTEMVLFNEAAKTEGPQRFSVESIEDIKYEPGTGISVKKRDGFTLSGDAARGLVRLVNFSNPFQPGGVPSAMITGTLTVSLKDINGNKKRKFTIYNDRLLKDNDNPAYFYYAAPGLRQALETGAVGAAGAK